MADFSSLTITGKKQFLKSNDYSVPSNARTHNALDRIFQEPKNRSRKANMEIIKTSRDKKWVNKREFPLTGSNNVLQKRADMLERNRESARKVFKLKIDKYYEKMQGKTIGQIGSMKINMKNQRFLTPEDVVKAVTMPIVSGKKVVQVSGRVLGKNPAKKKEGIDWVRTTLLPVIVFTDTEGKKSYFTLSEKVKEALKTKGAFNVFMLNEQFSWGEGGGSDEEFVANLGRMYTETFEITWRDINGKVKVGGFFKWLCAIEDLPKNVIEEMGRLQIYHEDKKDNYDNNCFINCLIQNKLDTTFAKAYIKNTYVKKKDIPVIAEELGVVFYINTIKQSTNKVVVLKQAKSGPNLRVIKLNLIDNHYFPDIQMSITAYALKNWFALYTQKDANIIFNKAKDRDTKRFIDSYKFVKILLENRTTMLKPFDSIGCVHESQECINIRKPTTSYEDLPEEIDAIYYQAFVTNEQKEELRNSKKTLLKRKKVDPLSDSVRELRFNEKIQKMNNSINETNDEAIKLKIQKKIDGLNWAWNRPVGEINSSWKTSEEEDIIVFADFESTTNSEKHIPYLCCWERSDMPGQKLSADGPDCGKTFVNSLKANSTIYFHNLGYDVRFLMNYVYMHNIIRKSVNSVVTMSGKLNDFYTKTTYKMSFKCSYMMTTIPLRNFGKTLGLTVHKEIMPYNLYTTESVQKNYAYIKDALAMLDKSDHADFMDNLTKWNLIVPDGKNDCFYHLAYSKKYCEIDVEVTRLGYYKFRDFVLDITDNKIDIMDHYTLPSVAEAFLIESNCYDGCYKIAGPYREYIQESMVGGRTMTRRNEKNYTKIRLSDFDAVSLYPSAMYRLLGYLMGLPKKLKNLNYNFLKSCDGYFVDIDITHIGKDYDFPLLNYKNADGVRCFESKTGIYRVDKFTLEDLIKFQKIQFTILGGCYFDSGRNENIRDVIRKLYNRRKIEKANGNPIQEVIKLLMNSAYGKNGLKEHKHGTRIIGLNDIDKEISNNYNFVSSITELDGGKLAEVKFINPVNLHFNSVHIGCEILSMSKRIMNEVMCLAEDIKAPIYYQDTDSMHIETSCIEKLRLAYKEMYNRELIGDDMGQFHSDFTGRSDEEIVAVESYFLGKKSYIDKLEIVNNGLVSYSYHKRMKGIPGQVLENSAKDSYNGDIMSLYEALYCGKPITFDLLNQGSKVVFKGKIDGTIRTLKSGLDIFSRKLQF